MIWVNWPFNVCIVSHICIKIKEIDTKLVQITTTLTHLTNVYQQQTASDEDWEPHSLFFFSLSSFVSMWPLQENKGGAQEITADPLCSPLPLIFTHSGNTSQIKACITTRVCMCVCFYLPATHTQGVFSCPDPCSLNCVHADLTHTRMHIHY